MTDDDRRKRLLDEIANARNDIQNARNVFWEKISELDEMETKIKTSNEVKRIKINKD